MHSFEPKLKTPLTKSMLATLLKVHENEKLKLPPLDAATTKSSKGLSLRGMVEVKAYVNVSGRQIMCLFLTKLGRDYLNSL